jgi:hypothetical protein
MSQDEKTQRILDEMVEVEIQTNPQMDPRDSERWFLLTWDEMNSRERAIMMTDHITNAGYSRETPEFCYRVFVNEYKADIKLLSKWLYDEYPFLVMHLHKDYKSGEPFYCIDEVRRHFVMCSFKYIETLTLLLDSKTSELEKTVDRIEEKINKKL